MKIYQTGAPNPHAIKTANTVATVSSERTLKSATGRPTLSVVNAPIAKRSVATIACSSIDYYFGQVSAHYRKAV